MKKLILLAIALSLCPTNIFSQETIDTTITNIAVDTLFHTIYYKDGSIAIHDSLDSVCSLSFGFRNFQKKKTFLVECATYTDGEIENIVDLEKVDRIEKKDGKIISGEQLMKKFRNFKIIIRSIFGGIIISVILLLNN